MKVYYSSKFQACGTNQSRDLEGGHMPPLSLPLKSQRSPNEGLKRVHASFLPDLRSFSRPKGHKPSKLTLPNYHWILPLNCISWLLSSETKNFIWVLEKTEKMGKSGAITTFTPGREFCYGGQKEGMESKAGCSGSRTITFQHHFFDRTFNYQMYAD